MHKQHGELMTKSTGERWVADRQDVNHGSLDLGKPVSGRRRIRILEITRSSKPMLDW